MPIQNITTSSGSLGLKVVRGRPTQSILVRMMRDEARVDAIFDKLARILALLKRSTP